LRLTRNEEETDDNVVSQSFEIERFDERFSRLVAVEGPSVSKIGPVEVICTKDLRISEWRR